MFSKLADLAGNSFVVPAVIAAVTAMLLMRLWRRRPPVAGSVDSAAPLEAKHERIAPAEARQWQVELHDLARSTRAELDTRLTALQQLLIEADRRIARLESLERRSTEKSVTPRPHFDPPPADGSASEPRTAAIYAMADAGLNAAAIANRLREKLGEVEATLRLRRG
jgi:hypothetical protein